MEDKISTQVDISLAIDAPFISQKSGAIKFGLDSALWRYQGKPAISGALIKGNFRHALHYFSESLTDAGLDGISEKQINHWFGGESEDAHDPQRGLLNFDYAWLCQTKDSAQNRNRYRIAIDPETNVVQRGSMLVIESPFNVGDTPIFTGSIRFVSTVDEQAQIINYLEKALQYLTAFGSYKSVGFGKLNNEQTVMEHHHQVLSIDGLSNDYQDVSEFDFIINFDRPLCLSKNVLINSNRFETHNYLPGNILKGSIAATLQNNGFKDLQAIGFDQWYFSHGYAIAENQEPITLFSHAVPLSIVTCKRDGEIMVTDLAGEHGLDLKQGVISYKPDWKPNEAALAENLTKRSSVALSKTLSIHTRIAKNTNAAQDQGLYSQEEILPFNHDNQPIDWQFHLNIQCVDASKKTLATQAIASLERFGINGVGRSKANTTDILIGESVSSNIPKLTNKLVITLLSDASLFERPAQDAVATGEDLTPLYSQYWNTLFKGMKTQPKLLDFFAMQHRVGGQHFHAYYQNKRNGVTGYKPEWLTDAGSVFIFDYPDDPNQEACIQNLLAFGLPPAHHDHWQQNPFIRENGYGRVAINRIYSRVEG